MITTMSGNRRTTLGLLSGWPVFGSYGTDRFVEYISLGVQAFTSKHDCNLLLGLGLSRIVGGRSLHTAWPVLSPGTDFVPVGPWNTDGLIVLAPLRNEERSQYLKNLKKDGFPIVFIGTGEEPPFISVDNQSGIHQAVDHLIEHGHRKIAFIAGDPADPGDSLARLQGFHSAMQAHNLDIDPRLIENGRHFQEGGYQAMRQILEKGVEFSAVLASNDISALGVIGAIQQAGLRIPEDVAVIGFDDQPLASGQNPPLTTVQYPLYEAGYQAAEMLYEHVIHRKDISEQKILIPARLVRRQSCGCITGEIHGLQTSAIPVPPAAGNIHLPDGIVDAMCEGLESQMLTMHQEVVRLHCKQIAESFLECLQSNKDEDTFYRTLSRVLREAEELRDDAHPWQLVINTLWERVTEPMLDHEKRNRAEVMLHCARIMVSEVSHRQKKQNIVRQGLLTHQMGWLSGSLFSAQNEAQIVQALAQLSDLGVDLTHVGFFEAAGNDAVANVRYRIPAERAIDLRDVDTDQPALHFPSREFPPAGIFPGEVPYCIAILPLIFVDDAIGFVVFDGNNLEPLEPIVRQVAAAVKSVHLHAAILEMSITDSLTGLFNRRYFEEFLNNELERSKRYQRPTGLIMIDLDHFKDYNDQFGHQAGDTALRKIAHAIQDAIRHKSDVVARYGGEEFIIALPETDADGAFRMAERIRGRIETLKGLEARLTISIGVAACQNGNLNLEALVSGADKALYRAKNEGRNRVCR
jgi:diguanylate cyclase (GGDEF)-like protein